MSKYIPELADLKVLASWQASDSSFTTEDLHREVTIHHLLTHTSGIPYAAFHPVARIIYPQFGFNEAWTKDTITLAGNIPKLAKAPLMHQPGEKWTYGTGIDVLGYIVEIVSGLPLDEYLDKNIFDPLGMDDMAFYLDKSKADRLVEVWFTADLDENTRQSMVTDYPVAGAKTYFAGGAGLVGTSLDYLKFASALLNGGTLGKEKILEASTVDMMFHNQIDTLRLSKGEGFGYGGSVRVEEDEYGRNPGHWGWDGFWQTRFRIDPENDLILILLTNAFTTPKFNQFLGGYGGLVVQSIEN